MHGGVNGAIAARTMLLTFAAFTAVFAAALVDAKRPGVIIHAVGDSATAGDLSTIGSGSGGRFEPHLSYRRYLAHMLTARGYSVRFIGSKDDCSASTALDFDSHHDGYKGARIGDIRSALNSGSSAIAESVTAAVQSLKSEGAPTINVVRVVMAGYEDAIGGRSSKDISEQDLKNLVETVESLTASAGGSDVTHRTTLVLPSPPPGGVRTADASGNGRTYLERDFTRDSRYEDYRFFLTWRGVFFDKRKNVGDCLSYVDYLRHYNAAGNRLNALGDQALARCVFDNLIARKYIPRISTAVPAHTCDAETAKHASRSVIKSLPSYAEATDGDASEPVLVNKLLPPLTTLVARAVRLEASSPHPTCPGGAGGGAASPKKSRLAAEGDTVGDAATASGGGATGSSGAAAKAGACLATPRFPEYEPFAETTKDLWKAKAAD